mgnify:CR=1 FL=1
MRRRETGLARVRDLDLCWSLVGEPMSPILMTIMGLGVQMTEWDDAFVGEFVRAGFQLLQFDNRDSGLSSKVDEAYTLEDMADDAAGLLDALGIPRVHVFGMSMGGMIGQAVAIRHPDRALSLASVMSTTGAKGVGRTARHVIDAMIGAPPSTGRSAVVAAQLAAAELVNGEGYPLDVEAMRRRAAAAYDRGHYPEGRARQSAAIRRSPDRTAALAAVGVPAVVIHGDQDPVMDVSGGRATAAAIPGARLMILPGMGHLVPAELARTVVGAVRANAERARTAADSGTEGVSPPTGRGPARPGSP